MAINIDEVDINKLIDLAIEEDIGSGDVTSEAIFFGDEISEANIIAKDSGIFCGGKVIKKVYEKIDPEMEVTILKNDGEEISKGEIAVYLKGHTKSMLLGERISLNFSQRLSGIATKTNRIVKLLHDSEITVLDTRKTLPGFRMLDKYAVKMGGGENHRIGLYDMVMIKDNHIKAAGSITEAMHRVRKLSGTKYKIEVETTTLDEVNEAIINGADIIMLDNMDKETMNKASMIIGDKAKIEISGNVTEENVHTIKDLKVNFVSLGALTHSVKAFDLSMKFL